MIDNDNASPDWRVHYETCPKCKPWQLCPVAMDLLKREGQR